MNFNLKHSLELEEKYENYKKAFENDASVILELLRKLLDEQMYLESLINKKDLEKSSTESVIRLFDLLGPIVKHICGVVGNGFALKLMLEDSTTEKTELLRSFYITREIDEFVERSAKETGNET